MDKQRVLELLRMPVVANGETRELVQVRDLALAELLEKGMVDHIRLVRVEKLLEFLLSRQVVESQRRPSIKEAEALAAAGLPVPATLVIKRTLLDEFDITYADFFQQFMKPQTAAPAAQGEGHAQEA